MTVFTGSNLVQQITKKRILTGTASDLRIYTLFILAAIALTLLVLEDNRHYLHIRAMMITITLTVTTLIVLTLAALVIKR